MAIKTSPFKERVKMFLKCEKMDSLRVIGKFVMPGPNTTANDFTYR